MKKEAKSFGRVSTADGRRTKTAQRREVEAIIAPRTRALSKKIRFRHSAFRVSIDDAWSGQAVGGTYSMLQVMRIYMTVQ